jgi:hypothetical protein
MPLSAKRVLRTFRYAVFFDGIDDRVLVPSTANDELDLGVFTLAAFFCPIGYTNIEMDTIIGRYYRHPYRLGVYFHGAAQCSVTFYDNTYSYTVVARMGSAPLNAFTFAAATYDGATMKGYVNGAPALSTALNKQLLTGTNNNVYLGYLPGNQFCGYIYCAMIYNRVLSSAEIAQLYSNLDSPPTSGLVLWLKASPNYVKDIDNDGILEWIDLSGYNNHGKIYGAVLTKVVKDPIAVSPSRRVLSVVR